MTSVPVPGRLSVVVPVYCNEASLPELGRELEKVEIELAGRGLELELIFVDDGSHDGSLAAKDGSTINSDCEYCHQQVERAGS